MKTRCQMALFSILFLASCTGSLSTQKEVADLIISGATVIHPERDDEPQIEDIVIRDSRIVSVGPDQESKYESDEVYDAQGRFVIPGLADMHSHFGNGILPPEEDDTTEVLARHLYFGNTTILNLGSFQAWPERIDQLREAMTAGDLKGPRLLAVGSLMTMPGSHPVATIYSPAVQQKIAEVVATHVGNGPIDLTPLRATTLVSNTDEVRQEVRRVGEWGANAIKLVVESGPTEFGDNHPQLSAQMIRSAVEEANPFGIPVLCHVSSLDELESCLQNGAAGIVHGVTQDSDFPDDLERRMKDAGFVEIPTGGMFDGWIRYPSDPSLLETNLLKPVLSEIEFNWLTSSQMREGFSRDAEWVAAVERLGRHLKKFFDVGGTIVAGTDTGNPYRIAGFALHEEIAFYVQHGIPERAALATATVNAARLVGAEGEWGRIQDGLAADLLILAANPLDDIANTLAIVEVVKSGKLVDRTSLPVR